MTYEGELNGTRLRVHIDDLDAETCYLMSLPPGDRQTWSRPLELTVVPDLP